jgi:uracil-DNA glycosylase
MRERETVNFNNGRINRITFVFSCPGQEELKSGELVFGRTGCNLELLLKELKKRDFIAEDFKDRYDFRITNSHNQVYYKGYLGKNDKRTEPLDSKIKEISNLERLIEELKETEVIICFGKKSKYALSQIKDKLNEKSKILYSRHLGLMSLNQIKLEKGITNRTEERIKILAKDLIKQFQSK